MKLPKCSKRECKERGTAFLNAKVYCQFHFRQELSRKRGIEPNKLPSWLIKHFNKAKVKAPQKGCNPQIKAPYWEAQIKKTQKEEVLNNGADLQ